MHDCYYSSAGGCYSRMKYCFYFYIITHDTHTFALNDSTDRILHPLRSGTAVTDAGIETGNKPGRQKPIETNLFYVSRMTHMD